jgi:hypothetical protein
MPASSSTSRPPAFARTAAELQQHVERLGAGTVRPCSAFALKTWRRCLPGGSSRPRLSCGDCSGPRLQTRIDGGGTGQDHHGDLTTAVALAVWGQSPQLAYQAVDEVGSG